MRQIAITAGLLLPLGLDTLAMATALGLAGLDPRSRLRVTLVFTGFEAAMPLAGVVAGRAAGAMIGGWADYVAIALLVAAALLMLRRDADPDAEAGELRLLARARGPALLGLGLGVSLDELTLGISAGLLGLSITLAVAWIAVQAFAVTQLGLRAGARLGARFRERSEQLAAGALLALAALLLGLRIAGVVL